MTMVFVLFALNFALLAALGYAVWIIAHNDKLLHDWADPVEPPEVFGEVWGDAE